MTDVAEIQRDKLTGVMDQMKRASEAFCLVQDAPTDENLKVAMLAHERAAEEAREYFYIKRSAAEAGISSQLGAGNRLRNPLRIA